MCPRAGCVAPQGTSAPRARRRTPGKTSLGLHDKTAGEVIYRGNALPQRYGTTDFGAYATRMQMIFQDPYSSLNPRMTAGEIIGEGLRLHSNLSPAEMTCLISSDHRSVEDGAL